MPGNLPVPNGIEMRWIWGTATSDEAVNVLHLLNQTSTTVDQAFADTVGAAVVSAFSAANLGLHIVPQVVFKRVILRNMANATFPEFTHNVNVAGTATNTTPLPANTSVCVSGSTGLRGRSFRSRTYLWGFSVAGVAPAGGVSDALEASIGAYMNTVRTSLGSLPNPVPPAVLSRWTTPPGASTPTERNPPILTAIASYALKDRRFDTQRRRAIPGI